MDAHEKGFFTEENSVEVVTGRNRNAKDERLKQVMEVITRKLHEAVKEIEPTAEGMVRGDHVPDQDRAALHRLAAGISSCCRT